METAQFLQPKHTMHGFEWKDQRGIEGTGFVRALRSLLTSHLPTLVLPLGSAIADQFEKELLRHKVTNGQSNARSKREILKANLELGYHQTPIFSLVKKVVTRANCLVFFGAELCESSTNILVLLISLKAQSQKFVQVALKFPEDVSIAAEVLRFFPSSIAPYVSNQMRRYRTESQDRFIANLVTRRHESSTSTYNILRTVVEGRLQTGRAEGDQLKFNKPV